MIVPFTCGRGHLSMPAERLIALSCHPSSTAKPFQVKALPTSTSTGSLLVVALVPSSLLQAPREPRQASATRPVASRVVDRLTKRPRTRAGPAGSARRPACRPPAPAPRRRSRAGPPRRRAASVEPIVGSGAAHVVLDLVGQLGVAGEQRVEQRRARRPSPATSAATIGGSARTTGICETPYSWRICDRLGDRLAGVGVHQVGQLAVLAAQHLADGAAGRRARRSAKPYCASHSSLKTLVR